MIERIIEVSTEAEFREALSADCEMIRLIKPLDLTGGPEITTDKRIQLASTTIEKNGVMHQLKIDPQYFRAVMSGDKTFEIRYNDRGYQKGDIVHLLPYEASSYVQPYEGLMCVITYVTGFNQKDNWVVFGIKKVKE